jgi:hypothetical protein
MKHLQYVKTFKTLTQNAFEGVASTSVVSWSIFLSTMFFRTYTSVFKE